jgi:hypothetical protein
MAKIALISQKLTPEFLGFAKALHFHRHEVMIITGHETVVPGGLQFEVLTYFKKWSTIEALRLFPRLLAHSPTVWHFVFSDLGEENFRAAQWTLAQLARAIPGRVVASSLFDTPFDIPKWKLRPLLRSCDIVTAGSRESLMYLKREGLLRGFCQTEVLPPLLSTTETTDGHHDQDLEKLSESLKPFLVVPNSRISSNVEWSEIAAKLSLVFLGTRPQNFLSKAMMPSNVYFVGSHLNSADLAYLLSQSAGLLTAFDDLSEVELMRFHNLCSLTKTPTLSNSRQAEALPGFCVTKKNGWILEKGVQSFRQLIFDNPELRLAQPQFERRSYEVADSTLNELNRLYSKVQHMKSNLNGKSRLDLT